MPQILYLILVSICLNVHMLNMCICIVLSLCLFKPSICSGCNMIVYAGFMWCAALIYTCEGATMSLNCPSGALIITVGVFGRESSSICPGANSQVTNCRLDVKTKVQTACTSKRSCSIAVSNTWAGSDPCNGVAKYLSVGYICTGEYCDCVSNMWSVNVLVDL
jgi:hypothetical protein